MSVEIIGRACVAAGIQSIEQLVDLLKRRVSTVTSIPLDRFAQARFWHPVVGTPGKAYSFAAGVLDDVYAFDAELFGLSKREASYLDPQQRILLQLVWRAMEDAALPVEALSNERVGVYIGASSLDNANLFGDDLASGGPYLMTGNTLSIVANRISHVLGLNGPSMTIDTACSSSLVALNQAIIALQSGEIDTAIVGGVNVLAHPFAFVGFSQARMLSTEGLCRAYGNGGDGYVRAEGGGIIILRRSADARANGDRSHAKIVAAGVSSAGRTNGISLPSREAQADLLRTIYHDGKLDPNQLAFIEGHGTGTKVGDPAEVWALGSALGKLRNEPLLVGSIKSNIGHAEPASGLLGLFKAMVSLEHDFVPATLHAEVTNEDIDFEGLNICVNSEERALQRTQVQRLAGVNSFGFGGTNAHIVISDPEPVAAVSEPQSNIFVVSAHTKSALEQMLSDYQTVLSKAQPEEALVLTSAASGNRSRLKKRFVVPSADPQIVLTAITDYMSSSAKPFGALGDVPAVNTKPAFVFSGNGAQWDGMALDAYQNNASFRTYFERYSQEFEPYLKLSLTELILEGNIAETLADTKIAQPLLFAVQASLTDCLRDAGIRPAAVYGHSVGEVAAAYAAGILTQQQAVRIVAIRSRSQDLLAGQGTMAAVTNSSEWVMTFAKTLGLTTVSVAAENGPNAITVSGSRDDIELLRNAAKKQRVAVFILDINYPFHHQLIDQAEQTFLNEFDQVIPSAGDIPFVSTVLGRVVEGAELDRDYWWKNVREPVLFQAGTQIALERGCNLFIEVGPRPILSSYVTETAKQLSRKVAVVPTLIRAEPTDIDPVAIAIATAVAHGAKFDGGALKAIRNSAVSLPKITFECESLVPARTSDSIDILGHKTDLSYTLLGWRIDPRSYSWKNHIDARLFPDLGEHIVDGRAILPGSAFVEIAVTAAQQLLGSEQVEVTNLEILRPLKLSHKTIAELWTVISPETGLIEIRSREYLSEDDWTLHVVARSRRPVSQLKPIDIDFKNVVAKDRVSSADIYKAAKQFGLDYGPRFQLISGTTVCQQRFVDVQLSAADKPAHPYVEFNLNPMSLDCAFQGIISVFYNMFSGQGGDPYVPVRFGTIRVQHVGCAIRRAIIEIERLSEGSIKARLNIIDDAGRLVATLEDCRFKRLSVRRSNRLESAAFHFETLDSHLYNDRMVHQAANHGFEHLSGEESSEAVLLLDAAVYRACFDVVGHFLSSERRLKLSDLPQEPRLRSFLVNALYALEGAGFVAASDDTWLFPANIALPRFEDIVARIYQQHPGHVVEAVLVNNVYQQLVGNLTSSQTGEAEDSKITATEATLDHFHSHARQNTRRSTTLLSALENLFAREGKSVPAHIVELGAFSAGASEQLAALGAKFASRLTIIEGQSKLRKALEMTFEERASTLVLSETELEVAGPADIIVSSSGRLFQILKQDAQIATYLLQNLARGAKLLAVEPAPSMHRDFMFGLLEDWFADSITPDFPQGHSATVEQWQALLVEFGLENIKVSDVETADGNLIVIEASTNVVGSLQADNNFLYDCSFIALNVPRAKLIADGFGLATSVAYEADDSVDILASKLPAITNEAVSALYLVNGDEAQPSAALQDHVLKLSLFAETLRCQLANNSKAASLRIKLLIGCNGGAPVRDEPSEPVATGVWTFARVLQNEYDFLDIHLLDAHPQSERFPSLVAELLSNNHDNREWILKRQSNRLQEVRAVRGPLPAIKQAVVHYEAATIVQTAPSRVESIVWQTSNRIVPGPQQVEVAVAATGLNFRDVMWAMGLLPEEALEEGFAGATIGMEFSGVVAAVGHDVTDLVPGDRVMGIGPSAFATHLVVDRSGLSRVPYELEAEAAATLPVAFLTAYYAIVELGRIREGETILIHGAAGGVGLAALQVAKWKGAKIIATAGTEEKRAFLRVLGADHVFDSRTLDFYNDTLNVTDGAGVDLVLNSLFDEAMERSIELVKPFGRFLELGKRDYYSDRKIGLRPFRRNISYFGIDADQLLVKEPDFTKRLFAALDERFNKGDFSPLPYRAFGYHEIAQAFRLMQNSGHIGKIIVTPPKIGQDPVVETTVNKSVDLNGGVCLVVGGIGGFGLAAANWMANSGASHIALATRSGTADDETIAAMSLWEKSGVSASVHACDVTNEDAVEELLVSLRKKGQLTGVLHAAMVLDDALISNLNRQRNRAVIETKVIGADILDRLTRNDPLEIFLLFSSATTMIGNPGQANYVAANGYLEGIVRARRHLGLPGLAIGFGAIADTGFLTRNKTTSDILAKRIGKHALKAKDALRLVSDYIRRSSKTDPEDAVVMISEMDFAALSSLPVARQPLFSPLMRQKVHQPVGDDGVQLDLAAAIAGKNLAEATLVLQSILIAEIATILRVADDTISADKVLKDIGLDSLMAMELGLVLQQKTGLDLSLGGLNDGTTVADVVRKLYEKVSRQDAAEEAVDVSTNMVIELTEKHLSNAELAKG